MSGLGVWGLDRHSMFGSEAATEWSARLPIPRLAHLLSHVDAVHGLYYLLMHGWLSLGTGEVWLRLPSVLAMAVTAALVGVLGTRLIGTFGGYLSGTIFALIPFVQDWAQNGRSYALVCLAVCVELLLLLRVLRQPSWRGWLAYGAVVVVAGYLHEMSLLVVVSTAVFLALARPGWAIVRAWLLTAIVSCGLVAPLVVASTQQSDAISYLYPPQWSSVRSLAGDYFGGDDRITVLLAVCALLGLVARPRRASRATCGALAGPLVILPPAALMTLSVVGPVVYDPRYVVFGAVGSALLAAAGLDLGSRFVCAAVARRTARQVAAPAAVAAVLVAVLTAMLVLDWPTFGYVRTPASRLQDFRGPAQLVAAQARPGDAVLFSPARFRTVELGYPADFRTVDDIGVAEPPDVSGTFVGSPAPPDTVRARVQLAPAVWVIGSCPPYVGSGGQQLRAQFSLDFTDHFLGACVARYTNRNR